MKNYESIFIIDPAIDDIKEAEVFAGVKEAIIKNGGKPVNEENWGKKRLAFTIERKPRKFTEGVYHMLRFEVDPEKIRDLNRAYRLNESIVRHMILKKEA